MPSCLTRDCRYQTSFKKTRIRKSSKSGILIKRITKTGRGEDETKIKRISDLGRLMDDLRYVRFSLKRSVLYISVS